jgi:hypothetical protein
VTAAAAETPIVYVRCPRTDASFDVSGDVVIDGMLQPVTRTMRGLDVYDVLPDVVHFYDGFVAPCDLVLRDAEGVESTLYDCATGSTEASTCAAMDPAVSFDGATVAFTVFRGSIGHPTEYVHAQVIAPTASNDQTYPHVLPNPTLVATEAQLHLVEVASGTVTPLPHVAGAFDGGPAWLADGRIAFTSTRDGRYRTLVPGVTGIPPSAQIWTMDRDGRNLDLASHHGLGQEEHPLTLRDGRVAFTSWQGFGGLPFRYTNGAVGGFTTLDNLFHLYVQRPDGAEVFALYGQHSGDHAVTKSIDADHKAAHFLAQTGDGRVWTADYYRSNNNGLGIVVGLMPPPAGQEGLLADAANIGDLYAPADMIKLAGWASSADQLSAKMPGAAFMPPNYADPMPWAGKLGHPGALPADGLMVAWGKGACGTVATNDVFGWLGQVAPPKTAGSGQGTAMNILTSIGIDTPGCDLGIYRAGAIPSVHPGDLVPIVDRREYHELMARAVVPYSEIHGVERPDELERADLAVSRPELPTGTPFGLLGAASITDRETHPVGGIHFAGEHQFHLQGTDTIDYSDDDLCGVRIVAVMPNRSKDTYLELHDVAGERLVLLGEVPVRKKVGDAEPLDPSGFPDTSFLVRFPANVPYLMQGVDCDGRTLNTDQTWQHLRPGEQKTCGGCHVHSQAARIEFDESLAASASPAILGEGTVPLLAGGSGADVATRTVPGYGVQFELERDVFPIFATHCTSCHGGPDPAGSLALDRPGIADDMNGPPSTWWCLVRDRNQRCVPPAQRFDTGAGAEGTTFRRPQVTRYVRALNARASLLYWKAAGERTDGRTDATFAGGDPPEDIDLDFGPAHPTTITPEELGTIARWIDLGSPAGAGELVDTQRPTLHLAAAVEGEAITELRVGTVDVYSGIDPASLVVCVVGPNDTCGPNLAPPAEPHGVVAIPVALGDPDEEVEARVSDMAGNTTVVRRTVRWLQGSQQSTPGDTDTDAGTGTGTGTGTGGTDDSGAAADVPTSDPGGGTDGATAGTGAGTGSAGSATSDGQDESGDGGCGCRSGAPAGLLGPLVALVRRRRRAAAGR